MPNAPLVLTYHFDLAMKIVRAHKIMLTIWISHAEAYTSSKSNRPRPPWQDKGEQLI